MVNTVYGRGKIFRNNGNFSVPIILVKFVFLGSVENVDKVVLLVIIPLEIKCLVA